MKHAAALGRLPFLIALMCAPLAASADPCKSAGSLTAQELSYDVSKPLVAKGIGVSLLLGLEPGTAPMSNIAKIAKPCSRGTMLVGKKTFGVFGENGGSPARWATSKDMPGAIAYFASMPRPDMALTWSNQFARDHKSLPSFDSSQTMYAVTYARGDLRFVVAYFDAVPDDVRLKAIFANALAGKLKPVRGYNVKTHAVIRGK